MADPEQPKSSAIMAPIAYVENVEVQSDARKAAEAEKSMTLWQALQGNWKAAL